MVSERELHWQKNFLFVRWEDRSRCRSPRHSLLQTQNLLLLIIGFILSEKLGCGEIIEYLELLAELNRANKNIDLYMYLIKHAASARSKPNMRGLHNRR